VIEVERRDGISVIRLDHGPVNALDLELADALAAATRELAGSPIVLSGRGRAFSAGVDLHRIINGGAEYVANFLRALDDAFLAVFDAPGPVVAAVNGHAIAGGCILAAACDLRLMSGGTIGVTELLVGLPFPNAGLEIMRHAVGPRLDELAYTGRTFDPTVAQALGLVHENVPAQRLLDEAVARAQVLAQIPSEAYRLTKEQLHAPARERIARAKGAYDARVLATWQTAESRAAVAAYLDRLARRADASA
jgi:enoyl-CoA hydratase